MPQFHSSVFRKVRIHRKCDQCNCDYSLTDGVFCGSWGLSKSQALQDATAEAQELCQALQENPLYGPLCPNCGRLSFHAIQAQFPSGVLAALQEWDSYHRRRKHRTIIASGGLFATASSVVLLLALIITTLGKQDNDGLIYALTIAACVALGSAIFGVNFWMEGRKEGALGFDESMSRSLSVGGESALWSVVIHTYHRLGTGYVPRSDEVYRFLASRIKEQCVAARARPWS